MRKHRQYRPMAEINVTNLVDVVLVLLIVFMISAPMIQAGVEIDLPKAYESTRDSSSGIMISIDTTNQIYRSHYKVRIEN